MNPTNELGLAAMAVSIGHCRYFQRSSHQPVQAQCLNKAYRQKQISNDFNNSFQFSFMKSKEAFNFSPKERFTYIATLGFCDSIFFSIW